MYFKKHRISHRILVRKEQIILEHRLLYEVFLPVDHSLFIRCAREENDPEGLRLDIEVTMTRMW